MNIGDVDRTGEKNSENGKGKFTCFPKLTMAGETIYLCSSLSGHAVLRPLGCLCAAV